VLRDGGGHMILYASALRGDAGRKQTHVARGLSSTASGSGLVSIEQHQTTT
jgi:hypothetical protein